MKYDLSLLNCDTKYSLWQVKVEALLAQAGNKHITDWNAEEKTKNPHATYV
jgi:hypothetical protein